MKCSLGISNFLNRSLVFPILLPQGQRTNREGAQLHPSADNGIKALLSKILLIRARTFFPPPVPPTRKLKQPLSPLHQRADRKPRRPTTPGHLDQKPHYIKSLRMKKKESHVPSPYRKGFGFSRT